jgi:ureidoglycolate hydrolase
MTTTIELHVEPLSAEAFAPYGQLIAAGEGAADYARPLLDVWYLDYRADAPARIQIMRYHEKPMTFSRLERHIRITEGRIPLNGANGVIAVADATGAAPDDMPEPSSVRAFRLDGSCGLLFAPGVWHSLDCFPVAAPYADFVLLSDQATEDEIEAWTRPSSGERTHVVDYASRDIEFRIVGG